MIYSIFWGIAFLLGVGLSALHVKFRSSLWPLLGAPLGFLVCAATLPHPWRNVGAAVLYIMGLLITIPLWKRWITPIKDPHQKDHGHFSA